MREEHTLYELFCTYRHELGYSFIACFVAVLRHWQKGDNFRQTFTNGLLCAAAAFGMHNILTAFDIDAGRWAYEASFLLGYVGVHTVLNILEEKIPFLKAITGSKDNGRL